jgi:phosphoglucosamine mutase
MTLKYFGTDGVRGQALNAPLSLQDTVRWGRAWSDVARRRGARELVLGWDPRTSSEPLAQAFIHGLGDQLRLCLLGLVPTPAVSWVTARRPDAWGLMISASHNPPEDNGLKGFDGSGEKLSEEDEAAIEAAFESLPVLAVHAKALQPCLEPVEAYLDHLGGLDLPADFIVIVDCAHGATAPWAPRLLRGPGVRFLGLPADGTRINVGVGSTHMDALQDEVRKTGAAAGIAFDGDGDRCLFVDAQGEIVDGDQLVWLLAQDLHQSHAPLPGVVGTLMSNGGLEHALEGLGIPFARTQVGDKFMLRELGKRGWDLAAEASGHIIQKHLGPSGDGLATAIACLGALLHRKPQSRWAWRFEPWPLKLVNIQARDRRPVEECERLRSVMAELAMRHGSALRMVVRWSGTEPKLRLMVEAQDERRMLEALQGLEGAARADLGL